MANAVISCLFIKQAILTLNGNIVILVFLMVIAFFPCRLVHSNINYQNFTYQKKDWFILILILELDSGCHLEYLGFCRD